MKKLGSIAIGLCVLASCLVSPDVAFGYTSPGKATGLVTDFAQVLSVAEQRAIEARLLQLRHETGFEAVVVTVPSLGGDTIEQYAVKLFEEWKPGSATEDTGLLILVAPTEREVKIETGYGTEGAVTDIQAAAVIRDVMVPAFAKGEYAAGISGAVDALMLILAKSPEAANYSAGGSAKPAGSRSGGIRFEWAFFLFIVVLNALSRILGKTKSWWLGGVLGAFVGAIIGLIWGFLYAGIIAMPILIVLGLLFDFIVSKHPPRSGDGHGGFWPIFFGGGHGDSSGGFGGFGGGSSGGGGASGRW